MKVVVDMNKLGPRPVHLLPPRHVFQLRRRRTPGVRPRPGRRAASTRSRKPPTRPSAPGHPDRAGAVSAPPWWLGAPWPDRAPPNSVRRWLGGPITVVGDEPHYALTTWPLG